MFKTKRRAKHYHLISVNQASCKKKYFTLLISLLVGLITGLGIAVIITLIITKSPIPFINKVPSIKQERSQSLYKQIIDPNRILYSNSSNISRDIIESHDSKSKKFTLKNEINTFNIQTIPTLKTDQIIEEKLSFNTKWLYYLHTNTLNNQYDAENTRAKLALLGFETKIYENLFDSNILYYIQIGPFLNIEKMNQIRNSLLNNNINTIIIRALD